MRRGQLWQLRMCYLLKRKKKKKEKNFARVKEEKKE